MSEDKAKRPTSVLQKDAKEEKWPALVIQGSILVPVSNPFRPQPHNNDNKEAFSHLQFVGSCDQENVEWLGPGLKLLKNHVVSISRQGIILNLMPVDEYLLHHSLESNETEYLQLGPHEVLCPGLIDLHLHAPQYSYTGTATERSLLGPDGWLERYAFPAEAALQEDPQLCRQVYEAVVTRTLSLGTTTAVYFATLHQEPCQTLVDIVHENGQRALIGKVCMDRNAPTDYVQSLEQNVQQAKAVIQYIHNKVGARDEHPSPESNNKPLPLILPLITPRFIPTCTPQLLAALGRLAAQYNCHITSHISESFDEVEFSQHLEATQDGGTGRSDAEIFDTHLLLTNQCIMAHGVHLTRADLDLMNARGAAIAHCPLSNFFFARKTLPCRYVMEGGTKVGLGTDVAGGYHPSMFHSMNTAVLASRCCEQSSCQVSRPTVKPVKNDNDKHSIQSSHVMDYRHAFYLATLGGAEALGLEDRIGTFAVGMEFDALVLSAEGKEQPVQVFPRDSVKDLIQKLLVLGDDRNVKHVFVRGRRVK